MFQTIVAGWRAGKSRLIYALLKEFERPRVGEGNLVNGAKCSVSLLGRRGVCLARGNEIGSLRVSSFCFFFSFFSNLFEKREGKENARIRGESK